MADTQFAIEQPLALRLIRIVLQYCRFGFVGLLATAIHAGVFVVLLQVMPAAPVIANVLAFCVAFGASFFGHFAWTFSSDRSGQSAWRKLSILRRFAMVALLGLALNTGAVILVADVFLWPAAYAVLPMVTLVPFVTFLASKYWAFAE